MSQRIVLVQLSDGSQIPLRGRLADIVFWIATNKHKLEPIHQGELSFNWSQESADGSGSFRPSIRETCASHKFST